MRMKKFLQRIVCNYHNINQIKKSTIFFKFLIKFENFSGDKMSKINKGIGKMKLAFNKVATNLGLRLTARKIDNECLIAENISYGKHKLQKYDIVWPSTTKQKLPVVFYVHGGAWSAGDKFGYNLYCSQLAKQGYVCVNINYRLIPQINIRTTVLDCIRAINHFCQNNKLQNSAGRTLVANTQKAFFVGDSAGAHIVSLICAKHTAGKIKLAANPIGLGLYYGVFDFNNIQNDPSPIMRDFDIYFKATVKNTEILYRDLSTTTYLTKDFPPCFLTSGQVDKLFTQTFNFVQCLKAFGIEHKFLSFDKSRRDALHCFLNMPYLKTSQQAFEEITKFFAKQSRKKR